MSSTIFSAKWDTTSFMGHTRCANLGLCVGWFQLREKIDWQEGEWPENQILISDWTYFHCPGATLVCVAQLSTNLNLNK